MIDAAIASLRLDYQQSELLEINIENNPILQFTKWWDDALQAQVLETNAMTIATVDKNNHPHSRIVLLKSFSEEGFIFFTNYNSDKGKHITHNANVSLSFFWKELERQVRIQGVASKISDADNDNYFYSRPIGSQLGAVASAQSQIITNRSELESIYKQLEINQVHHPVQRPAHWGGYIVQHTSIEFWQGRSSRLHDRLRYRMDEEGNWIIERLNP
jgi:pyridoxamine 5'-phosphate oxidase